MGEQDEESDCKFESNMRRNTLKPLRPILTYALHRIMKTPFMVR